MMELLTVTVGSTNPVKINAVNEAFKIVFPSYSIVCMGYASQSGVSDQPMTDQETFDGALNRAKFCQNSIKTDFHVGVEGGVDSFNSQLHAFAWVVVLSGNQMGKARTSTFDLPPKIARLVMQGIELGKADDMVFGRENSKQNDGAVGLLTHGVIDRKKYYQEAVILALIPFINKNLY